MEKVNLREYKDYHAKSVESLYQSVGWNLYVKDPVKLKKAYEHSLYIVGAFQQDKLVGIIRVVGDGISIIFIQDLLVHADYQRQGIGKSLITAVFDKYAGVRQKALLTDDFPSQKAFYRSLGLVPIQETKGICFVKYTV